MPGLDTPMRRLLTTLFCIVSIVLMATSQLVPWVSWVDVEANIGGVADLRLNADFYSYKIHYEAEAQVETGMVGGLVGGFGDIANIGSDGNITQSDTVLYIEGMERLQGVVGLLYDTSRDVHYTNNPKTWNSTGTWLRVNTHTNLIPWWPEGIPQELTITVTLNTTDNVKEVRINRVWIDVFKDWNDDDRDYEQSTTLWEMEPNDVLRKEGDEAVYKHSVSVYKDWGEKIGLVGMVDITLIDNEDQEDYKQVESFPTKSHPRTINIIPQTQGQLVSVLLMFMALPVAIIGMVFSGIALIFTLLGKKRRLHLLLAGAIIDWTSVAFFMIGSKSLVNMIDLINEEWFVYNPVGLGLPVIAGILMLLVFIIEWKFGPKAEPEPEAEEDEIKFDISAAMAGEEEEEEEEESFGCPNCSAVLKASDNVCPECGEEFEDDNEEGDAFACPACKAVIGESDTVCPHCGEEFEEEEGEVERPEPPGE